MSLVFYKKK